VGEKGPGLKNRGGKLTIKLVKDGPLLLSGNVTLKAGSGRLAWEGESVALCRCGESKNKPFCDGSHQVAGFRAE
jgi:CDGSH-type Zn-finger protein